VCTRGGKVSKRLMNTYAEAIRKKPNSAEAYLGLASLADAEGKPDESKMYEEKASSLEPENQAVLLMLALRDFRNDKYQEAKSKLDQADAISSCPNGGWDEGVLG
jgi:cytochrome c-type biogenesis protein CcmH/NrfG